MSCDSGVAFSATWRKPHATLQVRTGEAESLMEQHCAAHLGMGQHESFKQETDGFTCRPPAAKEHQGPIWQQCKYTELALCHEAGYRGMKPHLAPARAR